MGSGLPLLIPSSRRAQLKVALLGAALIAGAVSLPACKGVDAADRYLYVPAFEGKLVDTALSDSALQALGARVVYRFKSVPNLVYLHRVDGNMNLMSLERSNRISQIIAAAAKKKHAAGSAERALSLAEPQPTFLEAGFDGVESMLTDNGSKALAPVRVAIIDSGVVPSTSAIQQALVAQTNYTSEPSADAWQNHATAIASVYAGLDWNGDTINAYAPNARLHSIKISFAGDSESTQREAYGALQLAVALDEAVSTGAKVVNLSFSYRGNLPEAVALAEKTVIAEARKKGVVFIAAAGNAGESIDTSPLYPARYDLENIIVVGNHSSLLRRAYSSNFGSTVDVSAQGINLPLSDKDGRFDYFSGTSFSVPVVGSAFALYFGANPKATIEEAVGDLYRTSENAYVDAREDETVSRYGRLSVTRYLGRLFSRRGPLQSPSSEPRVLPAWRTAQ